MLWYPSLTTASSAAAAVTALCRPDRSWAERYQEDVFRLLPAFKPQELANVLWAMASLNMKVPEVRGGGDWPAGISNRSQDHL